jgi:hypothetical protein
MLRLLAEPESNMPFRPHVIALLETGLAECPQYHAALDSLVERAGLAPERLAAARSRAEQRNRATGRFTKAPKRIVAQEVLRDLGTGRADDDRILAEIATALCKGMFPHATPEGLAAIKALRAARDEEAKEAAAQRAAYEREKREVEQAKARVATQKAARRAELHDCFLQISSLENEQQRGYALERFLNEYFEF